MKIIDTHAHVISQDQEQWPHRPLSGTPLAWALERPIAAEDMMEGMNTAGITQAVLVQATNLYGYDNGYVIDCAQRWPDRFVAVGTFEPVAPEAAERLDKALAGGLAGVRLFTTDGDPRSKQGMWFSDEATDAFWAAATERQVSVCLQLRLDETTLPGLQRVLETNPGVVIALDHCGYPNVTSSPEGAASKLATLAEHPGLHLKITHRTLESLQPMGKDAEPFLHGLLASFGAERLAWGSNAPAAAQPLGELVTLATDVLGQLSESEQTAIFSGTARRLYAGLTIPAEGSA